MAGMNFRRTVIFGILALLAAGCGATAMAQDPTPYDPEYYPWKLVKFDAFGTEITTADLFNDNGRLPVDPVKNDNIYRADLPATIGTTTVTGYILRTPSNSHLYIQSDIKTALTVLTGSGGSTTDMDDIYFQGENMEVGTLQLRMRFSDIYFTPVDGSSTTSMTVTDIFFGHEGGSGAPANSTAYITDGATVTANRKFVVGQRNQSGSVVTVEQTGGEVNILGTGTTEDFFIIGNSGAVSSNTTSVYNLSGGSLNSAITAYVGFNSHGNLNITGGEADLAAVILGRDSGVSGTLTLSSSGTLILSGDVSRGSGSSTVSLGTGTVKASADHTWNANLQNVTLTGNTTFDTDGHTITFAADSSGAGGMTVTGGGTMAFTGTNTFTGGVALDNTTVRIDGGSLSLDSLTGTGTVALNSATITSTGGQTWATTLSVSLTGTGDDATVFDTTDGDITISTNLTGSGGVRKIGTGELIFTTYSTFTGGLTIDEGAVRLTAARNGNNSALCPGGTITINEDGALILVGNENLGYNSTTSIPHIVINGGTMTAAGTASNHFISLNKVTLNGGLINATTTTADARDFMFCGEVHVTADSTISARIALRDFTAHTGTGPKVKAWFNVDAGATLTVTSPTITPNSSLPHDVIDKFGQGTMTVSSTLGQTTVDSVLYVMGEYVHDGVYQRTGGTTSGAITVKADSTLPDAGTTAKYLLAGGTVNSTVIDIGGGAEGTMSTFEWTSGTLGTAATITVSQNGEFIAKNQVLHIARGAAETGALIIDGGTVDVKGLFLTETNTGTATGEFTLTGGGTLVVGDGHVQKGRSYATFNLGDGTIKASANHFWGAGLTNVSFTGNTTFDVPSGLTIDFRVGNSDTTATTGTGGITKTGAGTLSLTGKNTFTGGVTVNGGTLALNGGQISPNMTITVNAGGTFDARSAANNSNGRFLLGTISSANTGKLVIDGGTAYVGGLYLSQGNSSGQLHLSGGGTLIIGGDVNQNSNNSVFKLGTGTIQSSDSHIWGDGLSGVEFTGITTFNAANAGHTITFRPKASGDGSVVKTGPGTLIIANGEMRLGGDLTIEEGKVIYNQNYGTGGSKISAFQGTVEVKAGTSLEIVGADMFGYWDGAPDEIIVGGTMTNTSTAAHVTIDGLLTLANGTLSGTRTAVDGAFSIGADIVAKGDPDDGYSLIDASRITFRKRKDSGNLYAGGKITTEQNATLEITSTIGARNADGDGEAMYINKHGDGTLILSGTSEMDVNLHAGDLQIATGALAATGIDLVNTAGTLNLVDSAADTNIFNLGGNYTQEAGAAISIEIHKDSVGNYSYDSLNGSGLLELGGTLDILLTGEIWTLEDMEYLADYPLEIFTGFTGISGDFSSILYNPAMLSPDLVWAFDGNSGIGLLSLGVPEPTTWAMMLAGIAALVWLRRRRA